MKIQVQEEKGMRSDFQPLKLELVHVFPQCVVMCIKSLDPLNQASRFLWTQIKECCRLLFY